MSQLQSMLDAAALTPVLLVACDYDGTLAALAGRPCEARPDPVAVAALGELAAMPHTHVAVISGRARSDLEASLGVGVAVRLIGSHGAETESNGVGLPAGGDQLIARLAEELREIAQKIPDSLVEVKPAGVALHYRLAAKDAAQEALKAVYAGPAHAEGVFTLHGDMVVELTVVRPDKGAALSALRHRVGATAVVFIGDDVTDEDAFAVLGPTDAGIKIGSGPTRAGFSVDRQAAVATMLGTLSRARRRFLDSRNIVPIEHHSILSDQRTAAIVDPRARIVWLCLPRIDSAPLFAELVGGPSRGFFEIVPASDASQPRQSYIGDSFAIQTRWPDLTVTDYFDCSGGRPYQRAGRNDLVRVVEGSGRAIVRFSPRLDYGRLATRLNPREGGLEIDGWPEPCVLYSPGVEWAIADDGPHQTATAELTLGGGPRVLELRYGTGNLRESPLADPERRRQSERFWSGWAASLRIPSPHADLVRRSALVLKALCHGPTGAIAAAATTSLPEHLGGIRNWDYRYCWPRDACLSAAALLRLGNTGVALKLLDWLTAVVDSCESPDRLRPLYTVSGTQLGPEAEIGELAGYGGSRPVRVGNAAATQVQLDVFGPIVDVVALLAETGAPITPHYWRLVESMVAAVAARWTEPDHGIWEFRTPRQHHVHTKVMCWFAVHRAMAVAEAVLGRPRPGWANLRDQIAADILANGYNQSVGAFTLAYGEATLDAAALHVGLSGLVPPGDPRFISTVEVVDKHLRRGPAVYRYVHDDGLPGIEGGFNLCTSWLIESLILIGRHEAARELLDQYAALAGPTGLLSEEYDPQLKVSLGNFPQAYSHLGLINAAVRLAAAGA